MIYYEKDKNVGRVIGTAVLDSCHCTPHYSESIAFLKLLPYHTQFLVIDYRRKSN